MDNFNLISVVYFSLGFEISLYFRLKDLNVFMVLTKREARDNHLFAHLTIYDGIVNKNEMTNCTFSNYHSTSSRTEGDGAVLKLNAKN